MVDATIHTWSLMDDKWLLCPPAIDWNNHKGPCVLRYCKRACCTIQLYFTACHKVLVWATYNHCTCSTFQLSYGAHSMAFTARNSSLRWVELTLCCLKWWPGIFRLTEMTSNNHMNKILNVTKMKWLTF